MSNTRIRWAVGWAAAVLAVAVLAVSTWDPKTNFGPLTFYADHTNDAGESIALFENLRKVMIQNGVDANHAAKPLGWIDAAIEKLKQAATSSETKR